MPKKPFAIGPGNYVNWSRREPDAAAQDISRRVGDFEKAGTWRHLMAQRGAAAYQGLGLGDLFGQFSPYDIPRGRSKRNQGGSPYGGWGSKHRWNLARAICDTFVEKIAGLDEPKTQMVATDAEWEIRRQGIWADRFIEGGMHEQQGVFLDGWDLCRHGFLLACVSTGNVAVRVEEDFVAKRVRMNLRSTLNTFIDPGDLCNGNPLTFVDVTWENPEYIVEDPRFKKHKDLIMTSAVIPPQHRGQSVTGPFFDTPMVKMVSAWRMPFGSFKGRDARFVGGKSIWWEDYEAPTPPLSFFGINRCLGDTFWSENFIEIMLGALQNVDDVAATAENTMRKSAQTYLVFDKRSTNASDMNNAKDVVSLPYDGEHGAKPDIIKAGLLHADYFSWADKNVEMAMRLAGIPDMHVSAQSPEGTDSGRAKRLEASLLPERHARKQRNWRHWVAVDTAKLYVRAARRIGDVEPNWQVTWPGQDFEARVSVDVLDIDDNDFTMRPYAVSEQKNTPADRAQAAQEMLDRQEITLEQFNIIVTGLYDVPKESKGASIQRRYVLKVCDEILHSDEKVVRDENQYIAQDYLPPPPWINPDAALDQGFQIYLQAYMDRVPQNRRNLLRRFLEDLDALSQKKKQMATMQDNTNVQVKASPDQVFPDAMAQQSAAPAGPMPPGGAPADATASLPAINTGGLPAAA